ncbi:MAG: lysoplasmalogenase, partial [Bacteroidetes bacterium]|nr:lysoplasmalogenase [Bacteroidota bacterium]
MRNHLQNQNILFGQYQRIFRNFTILFILIFIAELISEYYYQQIPVFHYFTKPLIMISLAVFFLWQVGGFRSTQDIWLFMGLVLSLGGDVFLMFSGDTWFMLGLGSFLFAHISYIVAFGREAGNEIPNRPGRLIRRKLWLMIPFVLYGLFLISIIASGLGGLKIPVYIYALVIMAMAITALNRWRQVSQYSFALVFLGALLFVISDSVLAVNKFAS